MGTSLQDLKYGLRLLGRSPGFTVVAVLSLALGIGANSTVFSIVDTFFLRPWPVKEPERLAMVMTDWPKERDFRTSSYPDYLDIRREVSAFSDVVAYGDRGGFISGEGKGQEATVEVVSQNFFAALGVQPLLGRAFSPTPDQAAAEGTSVILSYSFWQLYFGGDRSLPGKTTLLDGKGFTVIGVMPPDFCGLRNSDAPGIWVTTDGWATMVPGEERTYSERNNRWFEVAGRLRPDARLDEARTQLQVLANRIALASPATNEGAKFQALPSSEVAHQGLDLGYYMLAMVGLVLLISCANVAVLMLAQMERRQREIAMRRALGAGPRRVVGQLLTEGLLLSLAGGVLGIVLASWLMNLITTLIPGLGVVSLKLDSRVLLFTAVVSLLTTIIFALAPGLRAGKGDLATVLKGEDPRFGQAVSRRPVRSLLVSGEIALSVVLLVGSALFFRSLLYSQRINPGFDLKKNVLMLSVAPPVLYGYSEAQAAVAYPALAARVASLPGVIRASYARRPPLTQSEGGETKRVVVPGVQPPPGTDRFKIRYNVVAPEFFATVGARLLRGREFNAFDLPSKAPVVIINDAMARKFWPGQDPVGNSIRIGNKDCQIVGVVESGTYVSLHEAAQPYLFVPFTQEFSFECVLLVETAHDPRVMLSSILKATAAVDKNLPIVNAVTLREYMQEVLSQERFMASLLLSLSLMGIFLATVGLYAAVSYMVNQRTHEIGIRMALGARRYEVLKLVLARGLGLSAAGAAMGIIGAFAASRLIARFIYGVVPTDPLSYAAGVLIAVSVTLLASYFPARRATKVDPLLALRHA